MKNDFGWIFDKKTIYSHEIELCRAILIQVMIEVTWHKIILETCRDDKTESEIFYVKSYNAFGFVLNDTDDIFSFNYLCDITGANGDLIRKYIKLRPYDIFKTDYFNRFVFNLKRTFDCKRWNYRNTRGCTQYLLHHDINLNNKGTYVRINKD